MTQRLLSAFVLATTLMAACGTTTPTLAPAAVTVVPPPTAIPSTSAPPTVAPNATPSLVPGPNVAYGPVHFTADLALGSGVSARLVPEEIPTDSGAPEQWITHPAYLELMFVNYPLQNTFHEPRLQVYPADEFAQVNSGAADAIQQLKAVLGQAPNLPAGNIPFLPVFNAAQVVRADIQFLNFQNGSGIRFVTQYDQAPIPINNHELFYTFQGLTSDGAYYVSAILPLSAPFLAPDDNPNHPAPADAVPAPDFNNPDFGAAWGAYIDTVTTRLNQLDPQQFNPALPVLDALVQSLEVK